MTALNNKIDFTYIILADKCNPNGDPNNGNRPRQDFDGYGEMSDVCIKHKLRMYLHHTGENILVLPTTITGKSLMSAIKEHKFETSKVDGTQEVYKKQVCSTWFDVRSFGMVFPFKGEEKGSGVSMGVTGPVSIQMATSIDTLYDQTLDIVKCVSIEDQVNKDRATIGRKHIVRNAVYVGHGSISTQLASLTGFSEKDAEKIKEAIIHMFDYDATSARPAGSMTLCELYWWQHDCPVGAYPPIKVFNSLDIKPIPEFPYYEVEKKYDLERCDLYHYNVFDEVE